MKKTAMLVAICASIIMSNFVWAEEVSVTSTTTVVSENVDTTITTTASTSTEIQKLKDELQLLRTEFDQSMQENRATLQNELSEIYKNESEQSLIEQKLKDYEEKAKILKEEFMSKESTLKAQLEALEDNEVEEDKNVEPAEEEKIDAKSIRAEVMEQYSSKIEELKNQLSQLLSSATTPEEKEAVLEKAKEIRLELAQMQKEINQKVRERLEELKQDNGKESKKDVLKDFNGLTVDEVNAKLNTIINEIYTKITQQNTKYEDAIIDLKVAMKSGEKDTLLNKIKEFESLYNEGKHGDKELYKKVNVIKQIVLQNTDLNVPGKLEETYNAYVQNRELVKNIHKLTLDAKLVYFQDKLSVIEKRVSELEASDKIEEAIENYEQVLENKFDDSSIARLKELYRKRSESKINVFINGKKPVFDVEPFIEEGRTLVPIRQIAETLGATVAWDDQTRTATITKGDIEIKLVADSKTAFVNSKEVTIDVPAMIKNGRILVPLRFISESFDSNVTWDDETKLITIAENDDTDISGEVEVDSIDISDVLEDESIDTSSEVNESSDEQSINDSTTDSDAATANEGSDESSESVQTEEVDNN